MTSIKTISLRLSLFIVGIAAAVLLGSRPARAAVQEPASGASGKADAVILISANAAWTAALDEASGPGGKVDAVILVSANAEWAAVKALYPQEDYRMSPFGEFFYMSVSRPGGAARRVVVLHGGWGKTSAAASTQYAIDHWTPSLLVNLGTCGGFEGAIERGAVVLAERTVIYDIIERMGDAEEAVRDYSTALDLSWLKPPYPSAVIPSILVSGDQDLDPAAIPMLKAKYKAAAGDWESGAIAYIAAKNKTRLLILRGVTDLVGVRGGEAYGNIEVFRRATLTIMKRLFADLPAWLAKAPSLP